MLERLKISRGWAVRLFESGEMVRRQVPGDIEHVVVPAESFNRMAAVVEAELAIEAKLEELKGVCTGDDLTAIADLRRAKDVALNNLRAHLAAAEKGGAQ